MSRIVPAPLPDDSLLARRRGAADYRDALRAHVAGQVDLAEFLRAFYGSAAFAPERLALGLIGRGASPSDVEALAEGRADRFAAWSVEAREAEEILLRDFQDGTCSWLKVEPAAEGTILWFGSGVRRPDRAVIRVLMPFHRWYARRLLASAVGRLVSIGRDV